MRTLTVVLVTFLALVCLLREPGRLPSTQDTAPAEQALKPKGNGDAGTDDDDEDYRTMGAWAAVGSGSGETSTHQAERSSVDPSGAGS
jgi:hypothetical protein